MYAEGAPSIFLRIYRWSQTNVGLPLLFGAFALLMQGMYIVKYPVLTTYMHGTQRFFHVAHLANTLLGHPDDLPVSFLEMLSTLQHNNNVWWVDAVPCNSFPVNVRIRFCSKRFGMGKPFSYRDLLAIKLNPKETFPYVSRAEAAHYSFLGYLVYVLPLTVGLYLQLPPVLLVDTSVAFNALVSIGLCMAIIRVLPALQWPFCFLMMLPSSFLIRSFVMPDALNMEVCFLVVAVALRYYYRPQLLTQKEKAWLVMLAGLAGGVKIAFFLVPLMYEIIPPGCFARLREKYFFMFLSLFTSIALAASWNLYAAYKYHLEDVTNHAQVMLSHPINYIELVYSPFVNSTLIYERILSNMMEYGFGWANYHWVLLMFILPLPLLAMTDDTPSPTGRGLVLKYRLLSLMIFLATWGAILTAMFLHYSRPVNFDTLSRIEVLQGRYFVPVIPCLLVLIQSVVVFSGLKRIVVSHLLRVYAITVLLYMNYYTLHLPDAVIRLPF